MGPTTGFFQSGKFISYGFANSCRIISNNITYVIYNISSFNPAESTHMFSLFHQIQLQSHPSEKIPLNPKCRILQFGSLDQEACNEHPDVNLLKRISEVTSIFNGDILVMTTLSFGLSCTNSFIFSHKLSVVSQDFFFSNFLMKKLYYKFFRF